MTSTTSGDRKESRVEDSGFTRREFLGFTSGLLLLFGLVPDTGARVLAQTDGSSSPGTNAWLHIGPDGRVEVFTGAVEIGQGARTALAQMVAEELTLPISAVDMVMGDSDAIPEGANAHGTPTMGETGVRLRYAAAQARQVLVERAAQRWGVPRDAVVVREGTIGLVDGSGSPVSLGELAQGRLTVRKLDETVSLTPPGECRLLGQSVPRLDGRAVVTGEARFVGDMRLPGMVYGVVLRPPCLGAQLASVDTRVAARQPGVIAVVRDGDFIGVAATRLELAEKAARCIEARWREPDHPAMTSLYRDLRASAELDGTVHQRGEIGAALAGARHGFSAAYRTSFLAHAAIEPHGAVAAVQGDRIVIHASTQRPLSHRDEVAEALGVSPSKIRVIATQVGGAFGGKDAGGPSVAAARLARAVGRPVMVTWSRREAMTWGHFGPPALVDLRCGVNAAGEVVAWDCDVFNSGPRGAAPPYDFPHQRVRSYRCRSPLRQGPWRGCGGPANAFAREVHLDHIASELGLDPVEFRLQHLKRDPRLAHAVRAAADRYGWQSRRVPTGLGAGFACVVDSGSAVAEIAEVEVDRASGAVRVRRVVVAQDSGLIVNPEGIRNQIEGAVVMGIGLALRETVRYEQGRVLTDRFASYPIPTIRDTPIIDIVLIPNPERPPQGAGTPALCPVAAAVANALFDATGKRIRELPLLPGRVLAALRGG